MEKLKDPTLEDWFRFWLQELQDNGYIRKFTETKDMYPFILFEGKKFKGKVLHADGKSRIKTKSHLEPIQYTPDFLIMWADKAKGIFYIPIEEDTVDNTKMLSHRHNGLDFTPIEIKAPPGYGGRNTSDASFRVKQKWVWEKYEIFVQKVYLYPLKSMPKSTKYLWQNTFTPSRYFKTDGLRAFRTINKWVPLQLDYFLNTRKPAHN